MVNIYMYIYIYTYIQWGYIRCICILEIKCEHETNRVGLCWIIEINFYSVYEYTVLNIFH